MCLNHLHRQASRKRSAKPGGTSLPAGRPAPEPPGAGQSLLRPPLSLTGTDTLHTHILNVLMNKGLTHIVF